MNPFEEHTLLHRIDTLETTVDELHDDIAVTNDKISILIKIIDEIQHSLSLVTLKHVYG